MPAVTRYRRRPPAMLPGESVPRSSANRKRHDGGDGGRLVHREHAAVEPGKDDHDQEQRRCSAAYRLKLFLARDAGGGLRAIAGFFCTMTAIAIRLAAIVSSAGSRLR